MSKSDPLLGSPEPDELPTLLVDRMFSERQTEALGSRDESGADSVVEEIIYLGERLEVLLVEDEEKPAVDSAMKALHQNLDLQWFGEVDYSAPWRYIWADTLGHGRSGLVLDDNIHDLHSYAFFGMSPVYGISYETCTLDDIKRAIEPVRSAFGRDGFGYLKSPNRDKAERTLLAAEGRLALDEGRGLTQEQLAALARLGIKSLRNALAPSSGSGLKVKDGLITADSARVWLNARGDFRTSIWAEVHWRHESGADEQAEEPVKILDGEILFVPFASDNTEFDPVRCQRDGRYTVGPQGYESTFTDYRTALNFLARSKPAAYWRRPNTAGNWGIVTAAGFHPRTPAELGLPPVEFEIQSHQGVDK
jgi:hypothetical protein